MRITPRFLVLAALPGALTAAPQPAQAITPEQAMAAEINDFRAAAGAPAVTPSASLERSAFVHSRWMMAGDYFGHAQSIRASSHFRPVGEVVEMHFGRQTRIAPAVRMWARSPSHRGVLLNPAFRYVGAGKAYGSYRGRRALTWTVQLGAPRG